MNNTELTLKEIQDGSLEVLKKLQEIFKQHNWRFYLVYGSLIGAIRHKGFIPWDDDIDIWVPRKDYEEFIDYYRTHIEEFDYYEVLHYSTNPKYPYVIARFSDSRYTIDYNSIKDYGLGLFIDLYPLDEVNPSDYNFKKKLNHYKDNLGKLTIISKNKFKQFIKQIYKCLFLLFTFNFKITNYIKRIDRLSQKYNGSNQEYVTVTCWEFNKGPYLKKDIFDNETFTQFENVLVPIPNNYDKILRIMYGDYMVLPPENERIGHHFYKAYKKI